MSSTRPLHPPIKLCSLVAPVIIMLNFSEAVHFPYWRISPLRQPVCLYVCLSISIRRELLWKKYHFQRRGRRYNTGFQRSVICTWHSLGKWRVTQSLVWPPINWTQSADLDGNPSLSTYVFWMPRPHQSKHKKATLNLLKHTMPKYPLWDALADCRRWKASENKWDDSKMHISYITALERQCNLILFWCYL